MFTQTTHFIQSISLLCSGWLYFVSSIELLELHDPSEVDIANKLIKFLDDKVSQIPHSDVKSIYRGNEETINGDESFDDELAELSLFNAKKEDLNKVLVKRVVPHELPQPFEHDFGPYTEYRPIMRIHKKGKTDIIVDKDSSDNLQFLYFIKSNKYNQANGAKSLQTSFKESLRRDPSQIVSEARRMAFQRSEEINDPSIPGQNYGLQQSDTTTKKVKWLPKYPFWNYWTYKKTIYQDECPGNQVALGNICIWVPPH